MGYLSLSCDFIVCIVTDLLDEKIWIRKSIEAVVYCKIIAERY